MFSPFRPCRAGSFLLLLSALAGCGERSPESTSDAGVFSDAGMPRDAGSSPDAGPTPPPPGEPVPDAGTATNAPRFEHYIRRQPYPKMLIEVDSWGGYTPTASVVTKLKSGLLSLLDKESIEVHVDEAFPGKGSDHAWTNEELYALAESTGKYAVPVGTIKLHVMLVDGSSALDTADGKVLGLAFPWTHLVLFRQTMKSVCQGTLIPGACDKTEYGVWAHEMGHQLGLVDNGLPMVTGHKDSAHGAHDASNKCTMYWAYEGSGITDMLGSGLFGDAPNLGFDDACIADINAVKNRP